LSNRIYKDLLKLKEKYKDRLLELDRLIEIGDPNCNIIDCHIEFQKFLQRTQEDMKNETNA